VIFIVSVTGMLVNKSFMSNVMHLCWAFNFSVVISYASCVELSEIYLLVSCSTSVSFLLRNFAVLYEGALILPTTGLIGLVF
jgi:hypothetical protein